MRDSGVDYDPIWRLEPLESWRLLRGEPASFWLVCLYILLEYVRPQSIYPVIDILPWAQTTLLAAFFAILVEKGSMGLPTPISGGLAAFSAIVVLSSISAWNPAASWNEAGLFYPWLVVYLVIVNAVTTERRFFAFLVLFLLSSLKMSQHATRSWIMNGLAFRDWGVTGAPGWFQNSGEFGIQMCVFLPMSIYFIFAVRNYVPRWKQCVAWLMPITAVIGMIASSSRGALVGGGLVAAWMAMRSRYKARASIVLIAASVAVVLLVPPETKDRFSSAGEDETSTSRLTLWRLGIQMANDHPLLGVGYRNFAPYSFQHGGQTIVGTHLPHNIFIEAWAELGYLGLIAFVMLISLTFLVNFRTRKLARGLGERGGFLRLSALGLDGALVGYLASGFFVTVLYYPYFWINLAMTSALNVAARDTRRRTTMGIRGANARRTSRVTHRMSDRGGIA